MAESSAPRPLSGLRVVALEQFMAGPLGSMLMADLGAEVIKVEPIDGGDPARNIGPYAGASPDSPGRSTIFLRLNRNKRSLAVNLRDPRGAALVRDLAAQSDILWQNFRPGVLKRLGLGYEELAKLNPRLIYVAVSGYGQTDIAPSPQTDRPAFDLIAQAESGVMYRPGEPDDPPHYLGFPLADNYPSLLAAFAALAAVIHRDQTGRGQLVDCAMVDAMALANEQILGNYLLTGQIGKRGMSPSSAPFGAFRAADGYLAIAVGGDAIWRRFCEAVDHPEWLERPEWKTGPERGRFIPGELADCIEEWTSIRPAAEAARHLYERGVPATVVSDVNGLAASEHLAARGLLWELDDPLAGPVQVVGSPPLFSNAPYQKPRPVPELGEAVEDIVGGLLGRSTADIAALRRDGVIA